MKRIITFSIIALLFAACAQNTPEANQKKAEALKKKIAKMEKQLDKVQTASDTIEVEKVFNIFKVYALFLLWNRGRNCCWTSYKN